MAGIILAGNGGGHLAIIDDDDVKKVLAVNRRWHYSGGYARAYVDYGVTASMHRVVMDAAAELVVDHINRNRLDNRRCNLRVCTERENLCNRPARLARSGFRGVSKTKTGRWIAYIVHDFKNIHLGQFETAIEAASAYDAAALKFRGEFARLNFPPNGQCGLLVPANLDQ